MVCLIEQLMQSLLVRHPARPCAEARGNVCTNSIKRLIVCLHAVVQLGFELVPFDEVSRDGAASRVGLMHLELRRTSPEKYFGKCLIIEEKA